MKAILVLSLIMLFLLGCQTHNTTSQIQVLGDQVVKDDAVKDDVAKDNTKFVVNGGAGSTEAIYYDEAGTPQTVISNVVKVPVLEKCEEPVVEIIEEELPPIEPPVEIVEPDIVRYQVAMHAFPSQILASHIDPPTVEQRTEVFVPRKPPQIELKKMTDEDQLCCDKDLTFRIRFTNVGGQDAYKISISDIVPAGTSYLEESAGCDPYSADIKIARDTNDEVNKITWDIEGPIPPDSMGEVFYTVTCARPKPKLSCFVQFHPKNLMPGEEGKVICRVLNDGLGPAKNVYIHLLIPEGLEYKGNSFGSKEDFFIEEIPVNQSVERSITVKMQKNGRLDDITARVTSDNAKSCDCGVTPIPVLTIEKDGPHVVVNRVPIEYTIAVANKSQKNVSATGCVLVDKLPEGAIFKSASDHGTYNAPDHSVTWVLGTITPGTIITRTVKVLPEQASTLVDNASVTCEEGVTVFDSARTVVRGISALGVSSYDTEDPIEVGGITVYVIEAVNEGFQNITDLELVNEIPEGSTLVDASGRDEVGNIITATVAENRIVTFEKYPNLASGKKVIYKITVKVNSKTQLLNKASLQYNEFSKSIIVEEPTETY